MQCRVIGYQYTVRSSDDLAPITERVLGVHPPSESYLDEFVWIEHQVSALGDGLFRPRPIPVQLKVSLVQHDPDELSYVLRQILQSVLVQRLLAESTSPTDAKAVAAQCSRFEIIEVHLTERSFPAADAESLECLARLVELGIIVHRLPAIEDEGLQDDASLSVFKSLQVLLPPHRDTGAKPSPISYVYVSDFSSNLMPALFSALQVNTSASSVELESMWDPRNGDDDDGQRNVLALWRWFAYALFSAHAQHELDNLTVHVDGLSERVIRGMRQVLSADNPLAALFRTSFENDRWLLASEFELEKPRFTRDQDERVLFRPKTPLFVRVIDVMDIDGVSWWRVLLPGCGVAWVDEGDATEAKPAQVTAAPVPERPRDRQYIQLKGIVPRNHRQVADLLELVGSNIGAIEVESSSSVDNPFDMTDWMLDALRVCPKLESLTLPWEAQITQLRGLVTAAGTSSFSLRELNLGHRFATDSSDVLEFLGVLSDSSHPLTRRLKQLSLAVSVHSTHARDFNTAWHRMLQLNRTLYFIALDLHADECVKESDDRVAIRTGPLHLASKLAFLSVVYDARTIDAGSARSHLDTGVLSIVLAFAAEHCVRMVEIEFDD